MKLGKFKGVGLVRALKLSFFLEGGAIHCDLKVLSSQSKIDKYFANN